MAQADITDAAGMKQPSLQHGNSDQSAYQMSSLSPTRDQPLSPVSPGSSSYQSLPSPFDNSSPQPDGHVYPKIHQQSPILDHPVRQETDAGTIGPIPPSYDPAWVQPGMAAQVTVDRDEVPAAPQSSISGEVGNTKR